MDRAISHRSEFRARVTKVAFTRSVEDAGAFNEEPVFGVVGAAVAIATMSSFESATSLGLCSVPLAGFHFDPKSDVLGSVALGILEDEMKYKATRN